MVGFLTYCGLSLMAIALLVKIYRVFFKPVPSWPRDTVVLHQIGRGPRAPSLSPFPMKLETYLRMADIPYVNDHTGGMSSKGKTPWISYNGVDVADSQLGIAFLNKKLDLDLSSHLDPQQRAVATALQRLVDEHLYWTMCAHTFGNDLRGLEKLMPYRGWKNNVICRMFRWRIQGQLWSQGVGRHTADEIRTIASEDLQVLADWIGTGPFLCGDRPCEQDCSVFSMLAQIVYHMEDSPHYTLIHERFPNLRLYCDRMKERFWSDWVQCTTEDYKRQASK